MLQFVFNVSDIVLLVLILVEIKCFNSFSDFTKEDNTWVDILKVMKATFGWSETSSSIRKIVAKNVLFPKFVFTVVAFLIEWEILYSENISLENDYPGGRWIAISDSIYEFIIFLTLICYGLCCTDICERAIFYFVYLLIYRMLDHDLNIKLLWQSWKYDEVNPNSIVTHVIFKYSIFKVVVSFLQLCKAFHLLIECFLGD